jgi:hypothetical protein
MGFSDSWGTKEYDFGRRLDEREVSEFPQKPFRDAVLKGEIKRLESLGRR